ncbi:MAG: 3-deoxy-manno-octulosonate cytidylyltransferase [Planctomycetota bacterium]
MKALAVIPARYGSSRFKAKVLAKDTGKFLVQHTYERALCAKSIEKVLIATDSELVMQACETFGADCVMTSAAHQSGTDRIAEAVRDVDAGIIVNLQADEPEIDPANIDELTKLLAESDADMATLVADFADKRRISDPNVVKVIVDKNSRAIYFSRSVIPYDRTSAGVGQTDMYLRHLGIYAYRKDFLLRFTSLPQGEFEKCEKLEQLRAIEHGFKIITGKVKHAWEGIDTAEQYAEFVRRNKNG